MKENHREILVVSNAKGKKFSLIETDNNYIVACGYDSSQRWGQQWEHGIYYMFSNDKEKLNCLSKAVEKLREKSVKIISHDADLKNLQRSSRMDLLKTIEKVQWNILMKFAR